MSDGKYHLLISSVPESSGVLPGTIRVSLRKQGTPYFSPMYFPISSKTNLIQMIVFILQKESEQQGVRMAPHDIEIEDLTEA